MMTHILIGFLFGNEVLFREVAGIASEEYPCFTSPRIFPIALCCMFQKPQQDRQWERGRGEGEAFTEIKGRGR
jgi:hypothetical protein